MKRFNILFGFAIILASIWVIATEQLAGTSADATINAQLTSIRTPIAGIVSLPRLPLGARLVERQLVASVQNERADTVRLNDLWLELGFILAEKSKALSSIQALDQAIQELKLDEQTYYSGRISEIGIRLEAAKERLEVLKSRLVSDRAVLTNCLAVSFD